MPTRGYLSQSELPVTIGLGTRDPPGGRRDPLAERRPPGA